MDKREHVRSLVEDDYCRKLLQKIQKQIHLLEKLQKEYQGELEEIYDSLHPGRKRLIEPMIKPVNTIIREFENITYVGKEFDASDDSAFYTIKGERVRSKSEVLIANELFRNGIPYHYELPIHLRSRDRTITIYPDFTALNKRTGRKYLLEHLGKMDDPEYNEITMLKLNTFEKNNILLGRDLILLHETKKIPLDTRVITSYINTYLL